MIWWILVILIVIVIAFKIPAFGKFLIIGITILVAFGLLWYIKDQRNEEISKKLIAPTEIQFDDFSLIPEKYMTDSFHLLGRIKNKSRQHTLQDLRLKVIMRDCIKPSACEIVGEAETRILATVPPGQSRDINESLYFANIAKPKGEYKWDYNILEIKGGLVKN
jgi:hypothetical protein